MQLHRITGVLALPLALLAACDQHDPAPQQQGEAAQSVSGMQRDKAGQLVPEIEMRDSQDEPATLADARGEPLLVNLWATWCAPCVKELPTLEALAARPGAPRVIAISQDMAPRGSVNAFLNKNALAELEVWHDPKMALSGALGVQVLPTTVLYDRQGREVWRYVGDLDWTGDQAAKLLADAK